MPLDRPAGAVDDASGQRIAELVEEAGGGGLEVAANGTIGGLVPVAGSAAELVEVLMAALVLLVTFGAVVAAGLPLLIALFGVAVSGDGRAGAHRSGGPPDWAMQVSIMIGLGVSIDYALLILTRFRAAHSAGLGAREANVVAMTTAGHSALVAGGTVVVALGGLFLMRLSYLNGVALAASLTVLTIMAATATLVPAVLGMTHRPVLIGCRFGTGESPRPTPMRPRWLAGRGSSTGGP